MRFGLTVGALALMAVSATAGCGSTATREPVGAAAPSTTEVPVTPQANTVPSAIDVDPDPRIGAIFLGGDEFHTCSASVLASTTGDLILTAAHCLAAGLESTFVPGFHGSVDEPWHVRAVYLDPRWLADQDPQADFAIARVGRDDGASVQAVEGGLTLGTAPGTDTAVTVTGYPMGEGGGPLGCRGVTAAAQDGFPSLPCVGLTDGFSGAPWVVGATVTGVVGGLDGGGCDDDMSFSPRFDAQTARVLSRAEAGGPGDAAPAASAGDC